MKDSELQIDRSCHVLYSKPCKKEILAKITLHYPEVEREVVWEQVQLRYAELLSKWRTDLGGKKNFHNGVGGTYDCIAIMCYYDVCRDVTTFREIEEMEEKLILPTFRKPYITAKDKQKKWLFGTVGMAVIAAALARIMMFLMEN